MITWLQKNKKYTQTAIWISTIAFVGAGFVGWGAYDYNANRANAIASVGDKKITQRELQIAYANLYSYYNSMSGGKFNKEEATKLNLSGMALNQLINQKTLMNIANDFGLDTNDNDIKEHLVTVEEFQTDGLFDKTKYYNLLKNANMTPKDYENQQSKQLLIGKLLNILDVKTTELEKQTINSAISLQDRISIAIIKNSNDITISEDEIKTRWNQTKNLYLSLKSYSIKTFKINLDKTAIADDDITKFYTDNKSKYPDFNNSKEAIISDIAYANAYKNAKQKYIHLKKSKIQFDDAITVDETSDFPITKIQKLKIDEISKPIKTYNGYIVAKLERFNPASPMNYENAKNLVESDIKKDKFKDQLKTLSTKKLQNFTGKDIGYISLSKYDIEGLNIKESFDLVKQIFASDKKSGFLILEDKSVVYQITDQRFTTENISKNETMLNTQIQNIKMSSLNKNLLEMYKDKYKVTRFTK